MVNEAQFRVNGYVATQPKLGYTKTGERTVSMRVGWTPRRVNKTTGEWEDQPSSFVSVLCLRKVADHAAICLHRGEPVILSGTLRVREYTDQKGDKRIGVDVIAESLGHDMSRGISHYAKVQQSAGLTAEEAERAAQQQGLADAEATGGPLEAPDDADAPGGQVRSPERARVRTTRTTVTSTTSTRMWTTTATMMARPGPTAIATARRRGFAG